MLKLRLGLFSALALGLAFGCGPSSQTPARVSGTVTYKGAPVKGGNLTFHTADKGSYNTTLAQDGTYELVDIPTGTHKVTVTTEHLNPKNKGPDYASAMGRAPKGGGMGGNMMDQKRMMGGGGGAGAAPAKPADAKAGEKMTNERRAAEGSTGMRPPTEEEMLARYTEIPKKYGKVDSSPLSVPIERGSNTHNFDLTD